MFEVMTQEEAIQKKNEYLNDISILTTLPYGYLDVQELNERIKELENAYGI